MIGNTSSLESENQNKTTLDYISFSVRSVQPTPLREPWLFCSPEIMDRPPDPQVLSSTFRTLAVERSEI